MKVFRFWSRSYQTEPGSWREETKHEELFHDSPDTSLRNWAGRGEEGGDIARPLVVTSHGAPSDNKVWNWLAGSGDKWRLRCYLWYRSQSRPLPVGVRRKLIDGFPTSHKTCCCDWSVASDHAEVRGGGCEVQISVRRYHHHSALCHWALTNSQFTSLSHNYCFLNLQRIFYDQLCWGARLSNEWGRLNMNNSNS